MDIKSLIILASHHWHTHRGLIFALAAVITLGIAIIGIIKAAGIAAIVLLSILVITTFTVWLWSNRKPKTPKGKVGFVVCIQYPDKLEQKKIREDFVTTLRRLLMGGSIGNTFHFIEIKQHISKSINDVNAAERLRQQTKSHFIIFGRVRLRVLNKEEYHILELDGIVLHRPLPENVRTMLIKEFSELFPRRLHISTENDLFAFNFTSDWTENVSKYIIGIASILSNDFDYAEKLFKDIQTKLESIDSDFEIYTKLKQRLPNRFFEINISRSLAHFHEWQKTRRNEDLKLCSYNLEKIPNEFANEYGVLLLRSVEAFLIGRNINNAIEYLKKCKRVNEPAWRLNLAFLKAYQKDLRKAIQQYRKCKDYEISPRTINEVEDFMVWILSEEPDKYQYHYCLGFFNWQIKGDLHQAIKDFELFLENAKSEDFKQEKKLALDWISEIQKSIHLKE